MDNIITWLIVTVIILLLVTLFVFSPPKTHKETFIQQSDLGNPEFQRILHASSGADVRNQGTLNCYDFMKTNKLTKGWIDESDTKEAKKRQRVLATMRTGVNYLEDTSDNSTVSMNSCYIPKDVGRILYDIDPDTNNCTINDVRTQRSSTLVPSEKGCTIDFTDQKYNSAAKINNILDTAFLVYDKENIDTIEALKAEIARLEGIKADLERQIRENQNVRDQYLNMKAALDDPNSECQIAKCSSHDVQAKMTLLDEALNRSRDALQYFQNLKNKVDQDSAAIDAEYNAYMRFK